MDFHEIWHLSFENLMRKFKCHLKLRKNNGTLLEDFWIFMIISRRTVLRRNISVINCTENQNTHFIFNNFFFEGLQTIRRKCISCCVPKATTTHSEYVVIITFSLQEWLHERASVLFYTYMACIVEIWGRRCVKDLSIRVTLPILTMPLQYKCTALILFFHRLRYIGNLLYFGDGK
jgi:hypothetical protein